MLNLDELICCVAWPWTVDHIVVPVALVLAVPSSQDSQYFFLPVASNSFVSLFNGRSSSRSPLAPLAFIWALIVSPRQTREDGFR